MIGGCLQRPGLPFPDLFEHPSVIFRDRVGESRCRSCGQVMLDVADRHPAGIQTDDHLVETASSGRAVTGSSRSPARPGSRSHTTTGTPICLTNQVYRHHGRTGQALDNTTPISRKQPPATVGAVTALRRMAPLLSRKA